MVNVRIQPDARLNVLLTQDRQYPGEHWTAQLPRLLEPQGVASYLARTVQEAIDFAENMQIHAAVIDLGIPMGDGDRRVAPNRRAPQPRPDHQRGPIRAQWALAFGIVVPVAQSSTHCRGA